MYDIEISSGEFDVLATGSVFAYKGNPISVQLNPRNSKKNKFKIDFKFEEDKNEKNAVIKIHTEANSVTLNAVNFNTIDHAGVSNPIPLATNNNSKLYVIFRLFIAPDREVKLLHYTFFAERLKDGRSN